MKATAKVEHAVAAASLSLWRQRLVEDEKYYFDPKDGEWVIHFIENNLVHPDEDKWAGKPFLLMLWQRDVIMDVMGWKSRETKLRRFREIYCEMGKGSGKTPWMAAWGMAMMFMEPGAYLLSCATDFSQARLTFDLAVKFIKASPRLDKVCDYTHLEINIEMPIKRGGKTVTHYAKWKAISGTSKGRHGPRPSLVLMDEAHEWSRDGEKLYYKMIANTAKRENALVVVCTNAASSRESICYQLHERARKVLDGSSKDETLYPIIHAAPMTLDWTTEQAAAAANPSWGSLMQWHQLEPVMLAAKDSPVREAKYRREYLGQQIEGEQKWLQMAQWDACTKAFGTEEVKGLPLYLGFDPSLSDDMTALVFLWVGERNIYVKAKQWIPKKSAYKYEDQDGTPFSAWAADKFVTLLDSETVDPSVHKRLAKFVGSLAEKYDLRAICFDKARAYLTIATLERKYPDLACIPVEQTCKVLGQPCIELERRLKDKSIVIYPNPCFRWQASNCETIADKNGSIRPAKEHHSATYAGRKGAKIDAISALVTGLSRACKHGMDEEAEANCGLFFL